MEKEKETHTANLPRTPHALQHVHPKRLNPRAELLDVVGALVGLGVGRAQRHLGREHAQRDPIDAHPDLVVLEVVRELFG